MGKAQDHDSHTVKRDVVVSASGLEVISHESFRRRLEGMSSSNSSSSSSSACGKYDKCANCTRERNRDSCNNSNHRDNNNSRASRSSKSGRKGKGARRKHHQHPKASAPIVIHLKDTLKKHLQQVDRDSDGAASSRSSEEDSQPPARQHHQHSSSSRHSKRDNSSSFHSHKHLSRGVSDFRSLPASMYRDVASIPEFVPSSYYLPLHQAFPHHPQLHPHYHLPQPYPHPHPHHHHHPGFMPLYHHKPAFSPFMTPQLQSQLQTHLQLQSQSLVSHLQSQLQTHWTTLTSATADAKDKSQKNLTTALISVIEKANRNEPKEALEANLVDNVAEKTSITVLNNTTPLLPSSASSSSDMKDEELHLLQLSKRRNMADCDNVDLICNDLSSVSSDVTNTDAAGEQAEEESGTSDDTSDELSVMSSSDTLSDDLLEDQGGVELTAATRHHVVELTRGKADHLKRDNVNLARAECEVKYQNDSVNDNGVNKDDNEDDDDDDFDNEDVVSETSRDRVELTRDQLEHLAEYTSGVPLIKYDIPQSCAECVNAWFSCYQHQQDNNSSNKAAALAAEQKRKSYIHADPTSAYHFPPLHPVARTAAVTAKTPRGSVSSESDLSSDVEDGSNTSSHDASSLPSLSPSPPLSESPPPQELSESSSSESSSSSMSSSSSSSSSSSTTAKRKPITASVTFEPDVFQPIHERHSSKQSRRAAAIPRVFTIGCDKENQNPKHEPKRATASWKSGRQLWDIDIARSVGAKRSRNNNRHLATNTHLANTNSANKFGDDIVSDSVYMDLTGLDVTYHVTYHSEPEVPQHVAALTSTWPYPVHSLYQAMYSLPRGHPHHHHHMSHRLPQPAHLQHLHHHLHHKVPFPLYHPLKPHFGPPTTEVKKHELTLPPTRPWINTGSPDADLPAAVFSVMCYNVLADKLCTKSMYAYCPTWALNWDYRKKGIMADIMRGNGDIITLQEVETEQYYCTFYPELAAEGYDGIFLPKSRVKTMGSDKEKKAVDGCAIFYKKHKFEKVNEYQIEFNQLATKEGANNTDTDMINRVSTKDNIAIVAVLRTKPAVYDNSPVPAPAGLSQMLMVSTAHIHWDPAYPDVKLVQTMMLIEELQKFVKETSIQFRPNAPPPSLDADLCNSMPLILCGDFNSLPDSGVYEFLSKGRLDAKHKDLEGQNYNVFMKDRKTENIITHNFKLKSAYKDVIPFTNYTFDFKGIIDYVFYSDQHLRLHGVMGLQDEEWFKANKIVGCPHPFVPSDHFPLFAEFSLPATYR